MKFKSLIFLPLAISGCISASNKPMSLIEGCSDGTTRSGFTTPHTTGSQPCLEGTQTCVGGEWIGPTLYPNCNAQAKNCGETSHGAVMTGFLQPNAQSGAPCKKATRKCDNGSWVGPQVYSRCSQ